MESLFSMVAFHVVHSVLVLSQHCEATFTVPPWADMIWRCPFYALEAEAQVIKWQLLKINQLFLPDFSELLASFSAQICSDWISFCIDLSWSSECSAYLQPQLGSILDYKENQSCQWNFCWVGGGTVNITSLVSRRSSDSSFLASRRNYGRSRTQMQLSKHSSTETLLFSLVCPLNLLETFQLP